MPSYTGYGNQRDERPTLPPIRDLFLEVDNPHGSSPLALAHLCVIEDENDRDRHMEMSYSPQLSTSFAAQTYYHSNSHHQHHSRSTYLPNIHTPAMPFVGDPVLPGSAPHSHTGRERPPHIPTKQRDAGSSKLLHDSTTPIYVSATGHLQRPTHMFYTSHNDRSPSRLPHPLELLTGMQTTRISGDERTRSTQCDLLGRGTFRSLQKGLENGLEDSITNSSQSKYECSHCGKGFTRPSSLKIHLNSHTGEKPFVCLFESCGRSFSVLSNMRRHARVHSQAPMKQPELSSDEEY